MNPIGVLNGLALIVLCAGEFPEVEAGEENQRGSGIKLSLVRISDG